MAYTLNGDSLYQVNYESISKIASLLVLPMPISDSDDTQVYDFGGATRTITITGVIVGTANHTQFKSDFIDDILDGDQSAPVDYVSDTMGGVTYKVKIDNIDTSYRSGVPESLEYTIKMIEADT
jgi:hypothetical protein